MKKMFLRLRPFIGLVLCSGLFIIGNSLANLQIPALLADIVNNLSLIHIYRGQPSSQ